MDRLLINGPQNPTGIPGYWPIRALLVRLVRHLNDRRRRKVRSASVETPEKVRSGVLEGLVPQLNLVAAPGHSSSLVRCCRRPGNLNVGGYGCRRFWMDLEF
jgi:hypothetical protein